MLKRKKYLFLWVLILTIMLISSTACSRSRIEQNSKDKTVIIYGEISPKSHDFLLDYYDLSKKQIISQINLNKIFSRNIFRDDLTKTIWVPAAYTDNLAIVSNIVKIIKSNHEILEIKLGLSPVDVKFSKDIAAITCLERGFRDVTTYFVNTTDYKIIDKIKVGGDIFEFSDVDRKNGILYLVTQDVDNKTSLVSIVDIFSHKLISQSKYPNIPLYGIKLVNKELWLCGDNKIIIANPGTGEQVNTINTDSISYQLAADEKNIVISHYYPDAQVQKGLTVMNLNDKTQKKINLNETLPTSITLDGDNIYVVDEIAGTLNKFNIRTNKNMDTYNLGKFPTNILMLSEEEL